MAQFAAQVPEPLSITELENIGRDNYAQTKIIDYDKVLNTSNHGIPDKARTFTSFEDKINAQFDIKPSEAASRDSKRVGVMGYKIGMTHFWDKWGKVVPCSIIQIDRCQVTQVKTKEKDGVNSIQIGIGNKKIKHLKKPEMGHFLKHYLPPKQHLGEFPCSPENFLPVGYCLGPRHFDVGQWVDVQATSKGKGFAGTIKRWNFSSQENSHGNSKAHRLPGSIGHCEFPGKVFKGKKMAGRLGNRSATVLN